MKKLSYLFIAIAILLSNIMCSVVAFNYRDMLCGIEHLDMTLDQLDHASITAQRKLTIPFVKEILKL